MATTPEELEAQRARVAELRQQIADHERQQAEKVRDDAAEAEMLELQAEELRLQADLAAAKRRTDQVSSNSSALDAARERMRREQARLDAASKPVAPSTGEGEEVARDRSTQDEEFVDPDQAPKTPGVTETPTPTAEVNAPATSPTVSSPSAPERTAAPTARATTSASGEGDK